MITRIYFRLPNDSLVHHLSTTLPAQRIASLSELDAASGYLLAPFAPNLDTPLLLIQPEEEATFPLPPLPPPISHSFIANEKTSRADYEEAFARCLEQLSQPDLQKIVLARTLQLQLPEAFTPQQLKNLFLAAAHRYPQAYVALIESPEAGIWLIATPELLLEVDNHQLQTMALAATLPLEEGQQLSPEAWSAKNLKEQGFVADYIDERLTQLQLSHQRAPLQVHTAGEVAHLCTRFSIEAPPTALGSVLTALHPTPAICGVPADRAAQLLAEIERQPRGYYAGYSGPVALSSGTHLYVTLRCFSVAEETLTLYAGAGLLADSDFEAEWQETQHKMQTMLALLQ